MATLPDPNNAERRSEQPAADMPAANAAPTEALIAAVVAADPNLESTTLALPKDALDFLRKEAKNRGVTTGDMVRIAIGTQKFLTENQAEGGKLQLRSAKGSFDVTV